MIKIAPSIASADQSNLGVAVEAADQAGGDLIHLDIEDGVFIPNLTFGTQTVKQLRRFSGKPFDVHLQVQHPEAYFNPMINAGADMITFQVESTRFPYRGIYMLKEAGIRCGLALNASTQPDVLGPVIDDLDVIHLMTAEPNDGYSQFIPGMLEKIRRVKSMVASRPIDIEVDGGINIENAGSVVSAGASILVVGRAIWGAPSAAGAVTALREASGTV